MRASREAAKEYSPRRKPWVEKKQPRVSSAGAKEIGTSKSISFAPLGLCGFDERYPRLAPWAAFLRRFAACKFSAD
jgi:hypothetical protein